MGKHSRNQLQILGKAWREIHGDVAMVTQGSSEGLGRESVKSKGSLPWLFRSKKSWVCRPWKDFARQSCPLHTHSFLLFLDLCGRGFMPFQEGGARWFSLCLDEQGNDLKGRALPKVIEKLAGSKSPLDVCPLHLAKPSFCLSCETLQPPVFY